MNKKPDPELIYDEDGLPWLKDRPESSFEVTTEQPKLTPAQARLRAWDRERCGKKVIKE